MTPSDRAQAAQRILDDPLAKELLDIIESDAIEAMLKAPDDAAWRQLRDTVNTIRALRGALKMAVVANTENQRPRPAVA